MPPNMGLFSVDSYELYDPTSGTFSSPDHMNTYHANHSATLLPNGKVLIAGGASNTGILASAEFYDPTTGIFSPTGSMNTAREGQKTTLLPNGKVLITGGYGSDGLLDSAELFQ